MLANERAAVTDAVRLADLWLDDVTTFPSGIRKIEAWSKSEWLEATFPVWSSLCDPIAAKAVDAMGSMMAIDPSQLDSDVPPEMRAMLSGMGGLSAFAPMMRQLGGAMLGGQIGTAIGELAGDMASSTDIGLPLAAEGTAALLPSGVTAFGEGLSVDIGEVRLFLALREAAHHRLFGHVPWLRQHLLGAVEAYAAGITVDMNRLRDALPEMDMSNPEEALREALSGEGAVPPGGHAAAEGRARPAGDGARPRRGLGGDGRLRRRRRRGSCTPRPWRRPSAAAAPPAARRSAPSPPSSASSSGPGCCGRRRRCGRE